MYNKFKELLDRDGVRPYTVSQITGIPASTFSDWKKGKSVPKADKIMKIAAYFNVTIEYFYENNILESGETNGEREVIVNAKSKATWQT